MVLRRRPGLDLASAWLLGFDDVSKPVVTWPLKLKPSRVAFRVPSTPYQAMPP